MKILTVKSINALGKTKGCETAPQQILKALDEIGSNEKGTPINKKLLDIQEIPINNNNLEETNQLIYETSKKTFQTQNKTIFLGGDHSISYPLIKGFNEVFKNTCLIVFDAHADSMKPGKEPTHEEWLRKLIEEGFNPQNTILIGVRNTWPQETEFLNKNKIQTINMKRLHENTEEICDAIMEKARNTQAFYISIDIDAVDPAFAPGTGYLEPGGMSSRELLYFLQRLMLLKNFKAADIVEINPKKDDGKTIKLGAKILSELI